MKRIFVDTGYWVACLDKDDNLHKKALSFQGLIDSVALYTSEMVLSEVLNYFSGGGATWRQLAIGLIEDLKDRPNVIIIPQTSELYEKAMKLYATRKDKAWSHTDCASFILMKELGISEALAFDHHFNQAGFKALMK